MAKAEIKVNVDVSQLDTLIKKLEEIKKLIEEINKTKVVKIAIER